MAALGQCSAPGRPVLVLTPLPWPVTHVTQQWRLAHSRARAPWWAARPTPLTASSERAAWPPGRPSCLPGSLTMLQAIWVPPLLPPSPLCSCRRSLNTPPACCQVRQERQEQVHRVPPGHCQPGAAPGGACGSAGLDFGMSFSTRCRPPTPPRPPGPSSAGGAAPELQVAALVSRQGPPAGRCVPAGAHASSRRFRAPHALVSTLPQGMRHLAHHLQDRQPQQAAGAAGGAAGRPAGGAAAVWRRGGRQGAAQDRGTHSFLICSDRRRGRGCQDYISRAAGRQDPAGGAPKGSTARTGARGRPETAEQPPGHGREIRR